MKIVSSLERVGHEVAQQQVVERVRISKHRLTVGCRRPCVDCRIARGQEGQRPRSFEFGREPADVDELAHAERSGVSRTTSSNVASLAAGEVTTGPGTVDAGGAVVVVAAAGEVVVGATVTAALVAGAVVVGAVVVAAVVAGVVVVGASVVAATVVVVSATVVAAATASVTGGAVVAAGAAAGGAV